MLKNQTKVAPIISIQIDPNITTLTKDMGNVECDVVITEQDGVFVHQGTGKIRVRGNTTSLGAKKPYNLKFDKKVNLFGCGKAKNWVLLADYYDATLMHNKMALELADELGLPYTPQCTWAEVRINDVYKGLYLLTTKIEEAENRLDIDSDDSDFLVEMEVHGREADGEVYFHTDQGYYFHLRHPVRHPELDPDDTKQISKIQKKMSKLHNIMLSGDWDRVKKHIDVDSFAGYYILNEIMKTCDFERLSVYFFYKHDKLYAGPAWDYDLSCGYDYEQPAMIRSQWSAQGAWAATCHYYNALMKYPEFIEAVRKQFDNNRLYIEELYIPEFGWIDANEKAYRRDLMENCKYIHSPYHKSYAAYQAELGYLRSWLEDRISWFDQFLSDF